MPTDQTEPQVPADLPPMNELTKRDLLTGEIRYAMKSQQHLWIVSAMFVVNKETLRAGGGESTLIVGDNLRELGAGCYVCEKAYDPQLLDRKCTGDPSGVKVL